MASYYQQYLDQAPNLSLMQLYSRTIAALPYWFGGSQTYSSTTNSTILNMVLAGFLTTAEFSYQQLQFCLINDRFGVNFNDLMTDIQQLDLFAQDFLGNSLLRQPYETNPNYKVRISQNLFQIKATRQAFSIMLQNATGFFPIIFEPWNIFDAMIYGAENTEALAHSAYGVGKYGSEFIPYEAYIDVLVPNDQGLGNYPGYNLPAQPNVGSFPPYPAGSLGGYGSTAVYGSTTLITVFLTFNQIAQLINQCKVFGTKVWFNIIYVNPLPTN